LNPLFRFCACVVAIVWSSSLLAAAATTTDSVAILAAENAWAQSAVNNDATTFAGLMSDDYTIIELVPATSHRGAHWTTAGKAGWVADVRSKRETYAYVHLRNLQVFLDGNIATVTGEYAQKATKNGKTSVDSGAYVNTWEKRNGRWQLINSVFP